MDRRCRGRVRRQISGHPFDPIHGPLAGLDFRPPARALGGSGQQKCLPAGQQRIPGLGETSRVVGFLLSIGVEHWPSVGYLRLCRGSSSSRCGRASAEFGCLDAFPSFYFQCGSIDRGVEARAERGSSTGDGDRGNTAHHQRLPNKYAGGLGHGGGERCPSVRCPRRDDPSSGRWPSAPRRPLWTDTHGTHDADGTWGVNRTRLT